MEFYIPDSLKYIDQMNNNKKNYKNVNLHSMLNYFNLLSAIFLVASLIFWFPQQRPALYLFFISYVFEFFSEKKWNQVSFSKKSYIYIAMFLLFSIAFIYKLFENSTIYFNLLIEKRLPLLAFSMIMFFGLNKYFKLSIFLNTFVITSVLSILYLIFLKIGFYDFITSANRVDLFNISRTKWINSHMIYNFYLNFSLLSIWFILKNKWRDLTKLLKFSYIIAFILIFLTILISDGRSGFITGLFIVFTFLFVQIWQRKKKISLVFFILLPLLLIGVVQKKERFAEKILQKEPRIFLWKAAVDAIKKQPVLGNGISDAQLLFEQSCGLSEMPKIKNNGTIINDDAHNQYLQITLEFGVFGICILLFLYIYPFFIVEPEMKIFTFLLSFMILFQSLFDVFITKSFSLFYCLLITLIISVDNNLSNKSKIML